MRRPMGYLGAAIEPVVAGPINGVLTLRVDVRQSAEAVVRAYGAADVSYDASDYNRLLREAKDNPEALTNSQIPGARLRNFVFGVMADVSSAVARAQQLADLTVTTEAQRAENHRAQAELVGAARIMLDSANGVLRGVVPVRNGSAGLGNPIAVGAVIAAAAMVYAVVGVTAVAMIALVYDSKQRMAHARRSAAEICERQGGCTSEQYTEIVRSLQLGPLDRLAAGGEAALQSGGIGVGLTVAMVGLGAVVLGGAYFLFGTEAGRRTLQGIREEGSRK